MIHPGLRPGQALVAQMEEHTTLSGQSDDGADKRPQVRCLPRAPIADEPSNRSQHTTTKERTMIHGILIALMAVHIVGTVVTVSTVGKTRSPLTPGTAAVSMVLSGCFIGLLVYVYVS